MTETKVNLACGQTRFDHGWLNIDIEPPDGGVAALLNVRADLLVGIPLHAASADIVYVSHFLEHLKPFDETVAFLSECLRVLKPGGFIRVAVPDFRRIAQFYLQDPRSFYAEYAFQKPWFDRARTWNRRLGISVMHGHKMLYDLTSLDEVLSDAGFAEITEVGQDKIGRLSQTVASEIVHTHTSHSVIVDAVRPKG